MGHIWDEVGSGGWALLLLDWFAAGGGGVRLCSLADGVAGGSEWNVLGGLDLADLGLEAPCWAGGVVCGVRASTISAFRGSLVRAFFGRVGLTAGPAVGFGSTDSGCVRETSTVEALEWLGLVRADLVASPLQVGSSREDGALEGYLDRPGLLARFGQSLDCKDW